MLDVRRRLEDGWTSLLGRVSIEVQLRFIKLHLNKPAAFWNNVLMIDRWDQSGAQTHVWSKPGESAQTHWQLMTGWNWVTWQDSDPNTAAEWWTEQDHFDLDWSPPSDWWRCVHDVMMSEELFGHMDPALVWWRKREAFNTKKHSSHSKTWWWEHHDVGLICHSRYKEPCLRMALIFWETTYRNLLPV